MSVTVKHTFPGPKSKALLDEKKRYVSDAIGIHLPADIVSASGAVLTDADGNTFIDLAGGVGCLNVGHSHPRVVRAIVEQAQRFTHTDFSVAPYESYVRLCRRLCEIAPGSTPEEGSAVQLRQRSGRERRQDRSRSHGTAGGDRVSGRVPRPHVYEPLPDQQG